MISNHPMKRNACGDRIKVMKKMHYPKGYSHMYYSYDHIKSQIPTETAVLEMDDHSSRLASSAVNCF